MGPGGWVKVLLPTCVPKSSSSFKNIGWEFCISIQYVNTRVQILTCCNMCVFFISVLRFSVFDLLQIHLWCSPCTNLRATSTWSGATSCCWGTLRIMTVQNERFRSDHAPTRTCAFPIYSRQLTLVLSAADVDKMTSPSHWRTFNNNVLQFLESWRSARKYPCRPLAKIYEIAFKHRYRPTIQPDCMNRTRSRKRNIDGERLSAQTMSILYRLNRTTNTVSIARWYQVSTCPAL
jgi:hypothetical protein